MKKRERKAPPRPTHVLSAETPKTGEGTVEQLLKPINIFIPDGGEIWLPVNRFRVDLIDGAVVLYTAYQNMYEEKVKQVNALTIPIFVFKQHVVNESKDFFGKSVDQHRVPGYQPVKILTPEELAQAEIYDSIVNMGALAISKEAGAEAWFGMFSPWQSGQGLAAAASGKQGQSQVTLRNIVKFIMQGHIFAQLWDEFVKAHDQIEALT